MNSNIKIITTYDNQRVQLIFNDAFLMPEKSTIIDVDLGEDLYNWKMRLNFKDQSGDTPFETKWKFNTKDFHIIGEFFNWNASNWIELAKPMLITDTDKPSFKAYFKIRTEMNATKPFFQKIHLSIWKAV